MQWGKPKLPAWKDVVTFANRVTVKRVALPSVLRQRRKAMQPSGEDREALKDLLGFATQLERLRQTPEWAAWLQVKEWSQGRDLEETNRNPLGSDDPRADRARALASARWWGKEELFADLYAILRRGQQAKKILEGDVPSGSNQMTAT